MGKEPSADVRILLKSLQLNFWRHESSADEQVFFCNVYLSKVFCNRSLNYLFLYLYTNRLGFKGWKTFTACISSNFIPSILAIAGSFLALYYEAGTMLDCHRIVHTAKNIYYTAESLYSIISTTHCNYKRTFKQVYFSVLYFLFLLEDNSPVDGAQPQWHFKELMEKSTLTCITNRIEVSTIPIGFDVIRSNVLMEDMFVKERVLLFV